MKKTFFRMLPFVAAVVLAASCGKDGDSDVNISEPEPIATPENTETVSGNGFVEIPFSIKVNDGKSLSKVALSIDGTTKSINFESTDVWNESEGKGVQLTVTGDGVSGTLNLVNVGGYKFDGKLSVEEGKQGAFSTGEGIDLVGTFTQDKGTQTTSTISFEDLWNHCVHTYKAEFKSTASSLELVDQNLYFYVATYKEAITINGSSVVADKGFLKGSYYAYPYATTKVAGFDAGKEINPSKLYTIGKAVTSVTLDKNTVSVNVNATETLTATVTPSDATNSTVEWSSDNTEVATVANGVVTGKKGGTATITATADGVSATCTVTVVQKVTSISISGGFSSSSSNPYVWGSQTTDNATLTATVSPADATNKNVTWSSSAPSIVSVDANGKIKIEAPNTETSTKTITITATAADGSGVKATYTLYLANYVQIAGAKWYTYDSQTSVTWANRATGAPSGSAVPSKTQLEALINTSNTTISGNTIKSKTGSNAYITLASDYYWSSTEPYDDSAYSLGFYLGGGYVYIRGKDNHCRVRLVRK